MKIIEEEIMNTIMAIKTGSLELVREKIEKNDIQTNTPNVIESANYHFLQTWCFTLDSCYL